MHLKVRKGVDKSDRAGVFGNRELDAVAIETGWSVERIHLYLPWARKLVTAGDKETGESTVDTKSWTTKGEVQSKWSNRRILWNTNTQTIPPLSRLEGEQA